MILNFFWIFRKKRCKMIELVKGLAHTEVVGTCFIDVEATTEGVLAGSQEHGARYLQECEC